MKIQTFYFLTSKYFFNISVFPEGKINKTNYIWCITIILLFKDSAGVLMLNLIAKIAPITLILSTCFPALAVFVKYPNGSIKWYLGTLMQCQNAGICQISPEEQRAINRGADLNKYLDSQRDENGTLLDTGNPQFVEDWLIHNRLPLKPMPVCDKSFDFETTPRDSFVYAEGVTIVTYKGSKCYSLDEDK